MITSQYKYLMEDRDSTDLVFVQAGSIVNDKEVIEKYLEKEWEEQKKKEEERKAQQQMALHENDDNLDTDADLQLKKKISSG